MRLTFFKSAVRALALSIVLAGGAVSAAAASDPPSISGRVTDAGGQPVDQVTVRVIELRREARTGSDGRFTIAQIPRGTYTVSFAVIGYAPRVRRLR